LQPETGVWLPGLGGLSRKRVLNPEKNIFRGSKISCGTLRVESPDAGLAMRIMSQISCIRIHTTLSVALLAACAANLALLCVFL